MQSKGDAKSKKEDDDDLPEELKIPQRACLKD
jgi:hypothetical protein